MIRLRLVSLFCFFAFSLAQAADSKRPAASLTWLGHAAFIYKTKGGTTVLIDPWTKNPKAPADLALPEKVDVILVTHGHGDHVGEAFELSKKYGAPLIASFELTEIAKRNGVEKVMPINPSGTQLIGSVVITATQAVHSSSYGEENAYAGAPLGFVVSEPGSPTIYHAGDTGVFGDMAQVASLYRPDVALVPIGGIYTMKPAEAAMAAKLLRAKALVPMHFGTFPALSGNPKELGAAMKRQGATSKMRVLEIGKETAVTSLY